MLDRSRLGPLALAVAAASFTGSAFAAGNEATGTLTVEGTLTTACQVSAAPAIAFGDVVALASTTGPTASTGVTFKVACSYSAVPKIYASGTRSLSNGTDTVAFNLSLTAGAASDDLPSTSDAATALSITKDGTLQTVPIYAKLPTANFQGKPSGVYTTSGVTLAVTY